MHTSFAAASVARTEQKASTKKAQQQRALVRLADGLHRARTLEDLYDAAIDALFLALECDRASVLLYDDAGTMRFVSWRGLSDAYRNFTEGHSPWAPGLRDPAPMCMDDIDRAEIIGPLREVIKKEGIGALAFVPLVSSDGLIGKFMTYFNDPHHFTQEEVDLSLAVARQLAFGIARIQAEDALRKSEQRLRAAFAQNYAFLSFLSPDGTVLDANRAAVQATGLTPDQVIGRKIWETWCANIPEEKEKLCAAVKRAAAGESVHEHCRYIPAGGGSRFAERTVAPVQDENREVTMVVATALDVTEYKELRDRLEEKVRERTAELQLAEDNLRAVTGHLLQAQDEERRRIARELHDSAGQIIAALSMNLIPVERKLESLNPELGKPLRDSIALVEDLSRELRSLSHLLHPPLLDEAGLEYALRWYVDGFSIRSKIRVNCKLDPKLGRLPRETEIAVFRIVQESLTNIHRHSGSLTAEVHVRRNQDTVLVEVSDQGRGFSAGALHQRRVRHGIGIQGMRERVRQLGGTLEVVSTPKGTTVKAALRLQQPIVLDPTVAQVTDTA